MDSSAQILRLADFTKRRLRRQHDAPVRRGESGSPQVHLSFC